MGDVQDVARDGHGVARVGQGWQRWPRMGGSTTFWTHESLDARLFGRTDFLRVLFIECVHFGAPEFFGALVFGRIYLQSGRGGWLVGKVLGAGR